MQAAWQGGKAAGSEDAARTAASQPFGYVLVGVISLGIFAYAVWNVLQAVYDTEGVGNDWKGTLKRVGYVLSSLIHLGLAWTCVQLATSSRGTSRVERASDGSEHQLLLESVLASDFGPAVLMTAAIGVLVFGAVQMRAAYTGNFLNPLNMAEASAGERRLIALSGKVGFAARGLVFFVLGYALLRGGLAERAVLEDGIKSALNEIATSSVGAMGLFVVSVGLTLYGAFLVGAARYRRVTAARVQVPNLVAG